MLARSTMENITSSMLMMKYCKRNRFCVRCLFIQKINIQQRFYDSSMVVIWGKKRNFFWIYRYYQQQCIFFCNRFASRFHSKFCYFSLVIEELTRCIQDEFLWSLLFVVIQFEMMTSGGNKITVYNLEEHFGIQKCNLNISNIWFGFMPGRSIMVIIISSYWWKVLIRKSFCIQFLFIQNRNTQKHFYDSAISSITPKQEFLLNISILFV